MDNIIPFPDRKQRIYNDLCEIEGEFEFEEACIIIAVRYDVDQNYVADIWREYFK